MSRAKTRRPGTRSDKRAASVAGPGFIRPRRPASPLAIPDDLPDAAEAALDDLLMAADQMTSQDELGDDEPVDEPRKKPPPAPGAKKRARSPVINSTSNRIAIEDDEVVDEHVLPEIEPLRFAVYEVGDQLATIQGAIVAAGHVVAIGGSGQAGLAKLNAAFAEQDFDAIVVGVPGGESLIDAALALEPRRPVVIASASGRATDAVRRAIAAGADLVMPRPHDVEKCAPILLAAARIHAEQRAVQIARGAEAVLRARLEEISDPDPRGLQPFEVFQRVLELEFKRARRFEYPLSVALFAVDVPPPPPPAGIRGILRARAGNALIHTIRDIDLATQLDHERFLVLLPYTDLTGAAKLGRRVIAAVAEGDPVVSAGRSFVPRVVGAVSSARPDQQLSFAKLLKDAQRALDGARRDGAELAVQP